MTSKELIPFITTHPQTAQALSELSGKNINEVRHALRYLYETGKVRRDTLDTPVLGNVTTLWSIPK